MHLLLARRAEILPATKFVAKGSLALSPRAAVVTSTDPGRARARTIIASTSQDREDDIVDPAGIILNDYARNPVVLWDHGKAGEGGNTDAQMSIGMSEDEDGKLLVYRSDDFCEAECIFHQGTRLSTQVCRGVMERWIRAASIGFKPIESRPLMGGGKHYKRVILLEWSWAAVGVNADAISRALSIGRIAGEPIDPVLVKSFAPFRHVPKYHRAWEPAARRAVDASLDYRAKAIRQRIEKATQRFLTAAKSVRKSATGLGMAAGPDGGFLGDTMPNTTKKKADPNPNQQAQLQQKAEQPQPLPPGAEFLKAFRAMKSAEAEMLKAAGAVQENPEVKAFIAKAEEALASMDKEHKSCLEKAYPGVSIDDPEQKAEDEIDPPEEHNAEKKSEAEAGKPGGPIDGEVKSEEEEKPGEMKSGDADKEEVKSDDPEEMKAADTGEEEEDEDEEEELLVKSLSDSVYRLTGERI